MSNRNFSRINITRNGFQDHFRRISDHWPCMSIKHCINLQISQHRLRMVRFNFSVSANILVIQAYAYYTRHKLTTLNIRLRAIVKNVHLNFWRLHFGTAGIQLLDPHQTARYPISNLLLYKFLVHTNFGNSQSASHKSNDSPFVFF